jgi:hypothetical protein
VIAARWLDAADADKNIAWTRDFWTALQPFAGAGAYVNDLAYDDEDRIRIGYGTNYARLTALKKKYDPENRKVKSLRSATCFQDPAPTRRRFKR